MGQKNSISLLKKIIATLGIASLLLGATAIALHHFGYKLAPDPQLIGRITDQHQDVSNSSSSGTSCPKEQKPSFQECISRNGKLDMWEAYRKERMYSFWPTERDGKCFISYKVEWLQRTFDGHAKNNVYVTECPME